jgi:hypothetical protein
LGITITIDARDGLDARNQLELLLTGGGGLAYAAPAAPEPSMTWAEAAEVYEAEKAAPVVEEAPKAKRGRRSKAEIAAEAAVAEPVVEEAPVQSISTDPENRVDPAEADEDDEDEAEQALDDADEEDDLIGGFAITGEGLMAAMQAHAAKFGIEKTQANGPALFGAGFAKRSDVVAAGEDAVRGALRNFARAIETGKAAG